MRLLRLSGRKVCERVKVKGTLWKGKHFFARYFSGPPREKSDGLYIGSVTSTKLHKSAVVRNRMRRRCREALRIAYKDWDKEVCAQLLILPRSSSLECTFDELLRDAKAMLSSLPPTRPLPSSKIS